MKNEIIIAIDGHSSCGKSTLARDLAKKLGYRYIDTGAMYRAVTFYCLRENVDIRDEEAVKAALQNIHIDFIYDERGKQNVLLNGKNIETDVRKHEVSSNVSPVSTIKAVRTFLVDQQQKIGARGGLVMDGRDIGTVVFPKAELKIFLTANINTRVERRYMELKNSGMELSKEEVKKNLLQRDEIDSTRKESPLRQAEDAIVLDNTELTPEEQVSKVYSWAEKMLLKKA